MKIIPPGVTRSPEAHSLHGAKKSRAASGDAAKETGKETDRDKITIGANHPSGPTDAQLIASLKSGIMADMQTGASQQKINSLKQQIALNQYDVNPSDIAKRLMLDSEANYD